ncbi:MAG: type II toxin-antitoxin system VapC family toxin [Bryobacteraceae bacterium]
MIFLDTSVLIESFTGGQPLLNSFRALIRQNERLALSSVVLYEWLRGPRFAEELAVQEAAFPSESIVHFNTEDATIASRLYRSLPRPRGREVDIMIAACAIRNEAELWTLNSADFEDIPGLRLLR